MVILRQRSYIEYNSHPNGEIVTIETIVALSYQ